MGQSEVSAGATVAVSELQLGALASSNGQSIVDGTGSTVAVTGDLSVGLAGTGTLLVQNDGSVTNADSFLGSLAGSNGSVTLLGAGSTWTSTGSVYVGGR